MTRSTLLSGGLGLTLGSLLTALALQTPHGILTPWRPSLPRSTPRAASASDSARETPSTAVTRAATKVEADRRVTFRLYAPEARRVAVSGEWEGGPNVLTRDGQGLWSVTVGPLASELYCYSLQVDGVAVIDPGNPLIKPRRSPRTSILTVPGKPPSTHEFQDVPHGTVHIHDYRSGVKGARRSLYIYTPPGYDADAGGHFPVLYLLHGSADTEAIWTVLGRTHYIADNLLAHGLARPLIIAMPEGRAREAVAFESELLRDVVPFVEANYRASADRECRAISGVSLGGGHALAIGLRHPEQFAWVCGFSAAEFDPDTTAGPALANLGETNERLRLLWIGYGKDDEWLSSGRQLSELLTRREIRHRFVVSGGEHNWIAWRRYLAEVLPILFAGRS